MARFSNLYREAIRKEDHAGKLHRQEQDTRQHRSCLITNPFEEIESLTLRPKPKHLCVKKANQPAYHDSFDSNRCLDCTPCWQSSRERDERAQRRSQHRSMTAFRAA